MIEKMNLHYSFTNPATVHDEEALTALELAGRQGAKINEVITDQNNLRTETEKHLTEQDATINDMIENGMPAEVAAETQRRIDDGTFRKEIDDYAGELTARIDNLLGSVSEGSTTLDAEIIDMRVNADSETHASAGAAIRAQTVKTNAHILNLSEGMNMVNEEGMYAGIIARPYTHYSDVGESKYSTSKNIYVIRQVFPAGVNKIRLGVDSNITLYLFHVEDKTEGELTPFSITEHTPVNGYVDVFVNSPVDFMVGHMGRVGYIVEPATERGYKTLEIAAPEEGYEYTEINGFLFDLEVTNYRKNGNFELPVPRAHFGNSTSSGRPFRYAPAIVMAPMLKTSELYGISIEANSALQSIYCYVDKYDDNLVYIGRDIIQKKGFAFHKFDNCAYSQLVISSTTIDPTAYYDPGLLRKITIYQNPSMVLGLCGAAENLKFIGDSITQGCGSTGYVEWAADGKTYRGNAPGYPYASDNYKVGDYLGTNGSVVWYESLDDKGFSTTIKSYLSNKFGASVKNYGMGGATVNTLLDNYDNLITVEDDVVIVMIGTNDRNSRSEAEYMNNLLTLVGKLQDDGKRVCIMSPVPMVATTDANSVHYHMEDAHNITAMVAQVKGVPFIPLFNLLEEYCETRNIPLSDLFVSDGVHPNNTGYQVMTRLILRAFGLAYKTTGATW